MSALEAFISLDTLNLIALLAVVFIGLPHGAMDGVLACIFDQPPRSSPCFSSSRGASGCGRPCVGAGPKLTFIAFSPSASTTLVVATPPLPVLEESPSSLARSSLRLAESVSFRAEVARPFRHWWEATLRAFGSSSTLWLWFRWLRPLKRFCSRKAESVFLLHWSSRACSSCSSPFHRCSALQSIFASFTPSGTSRR